MADLAIFTPSAMKAKKGSKNRKKTHLMRKTSSRTRSRARSSARPSSRPSVPPSVNPPAPPRTLGVKTCEEVEVGDLGGFGSTEELEAHEKRCGEQATEFCHSCGRNLCRNHYELVHRDHDTSVGRTASQGLTS